MREIKPEIEALNEELETLKTRALELEAVFEIREWTPAEIAEINAAADRDRVLRSQIAAYA